METSSLLARAFQACRRLGPIALVLPLLAGAAGCTAPAVPSASVPVLQANLDGAVVTRVPFAETAACGGAFARHALDSVSLTAPEGGVRMFDSNGSGVALGDLNRDGLPEIIFANLSQPNVILWNQGDLGFRRMSLPVSNSRAAAAVDVDGDSLLDVVFTRRQAPPLAYLAQANDLTAAAPAFSETVLPGVSKFAYSMTWADADRDGDLDLLTGSYDLELQSLLGEAFEGQTASGVYWHAYADGRFQSHLLARRSQALALAAVPQEDGMLFTAGNDFLLPDGAWQWRETGWESLHPFPHTTQNTMSFSAGDVDNDGRLDLFAADMRPREMNDEAHAAWAPVMAKVLEDPADRQITENVLQVRQAGGEFRNAAADAGISATGWTWSSQLADFDQDGYLDLYVVNGMNAVELFGHLPRNELVETNWAFRNEKGQGFATAPEWNLGLTEGGRGMTVGDVDFDGDLDIVVSNLLAPAVLLENRLCQGASIQVQLRHGRTHNTHGVGARLILRTDAGTQIRLLEAAAGYLSGLPPVVHFGFPETTQLESLEVQWPDGAVQEVRGLPPNHMFTVIRTD